MATPLPDEMTAIEITEPGGPEVLRPGTVISMAIISSGRGVGMRISSGESGEKIYLKKS